LRYEQANDADLSYGLASVAAGKDIFRYDTFGDDTQRTDALRLQEVITAAADPTHRTFSGPEGGRRGP